MKNLLVSMVLGLLLSAMVAAQTRRTDRDYDGFVGVAKTVHVEIAKLSSKSGQWVEGKSKLERLIEYDRQGNRVKEEIYIDAEDILYPSNNPCFLTPIANTFISYRYDAQGNRTDNLSIEDMQGNIQPRMRKWVFVDDAKGNRVSETIYRDFACAFVPKVGHKLIGAYTHSYDEKGQRTATTFADGGLLLYKWTYEHDESGNLSEVSKYSGNYLLVRQAYKYEFDAKGNWVKRITSKWVTKNGRSYFEPVEVTHRSIMYY